MPKVAEGVKGGTGVQTWLCLAVEETRTRPPGTRAERPFVAVEATLVPCRESGRREGGWGPPGLPWGLQQEG